ncbi:NADH dehydrogenase 1 alpha subcomplex assembly factor 3 [Favolaschia claudopus]|uniref:NADH dehydrogenase [ubiquinone] 1 alpha subcomplex assembly factor 3 n=1 Tax=Favolaschia claudopus TaxID=2862362 RepID=A0AAW0EDP4_9AGAR
MARLSSRLLHTTHPRLESSANSPRGPPVTLTNILASGTPPAVQVASITPAGIYLEDGLHLTGACIFLEGKVFLWDPPPSVSDWRREHMEVFEVAVPRPEILILGTGADLAHPPPSINSYLTELGIQLDVMSTRNACSTYNLLAEEGRRVAAALVPLTPRPWSRAAIKAP